jgi:EAL domain-containing protein (putative c-di-GMP-specific phosphodiesterase class I)/DNA-binding response OmpR family regulator
MNRNILVIEDEFPILDVITDVLKTTGYNVKAASNGVLGIKMAHEQPIPDLILCDINMPDKNGFQVIKAIKHIQATKNIPYIFISAKTGAENIKKGLDFGAGDYLTKPFTIDELLTAVENQLQNISATLRPDTNNILLAHDYDTLTGLGKRSLLNKHLTESAQDTDKKIALLIIAVNQIDKLEMLLDEKEMKSLTKKIIAKIQSSLNNDQSLYYLDNQKLAVLTNNGDKYFNTLLASAIIKSVAKPITLQKQKVNLSSNVGIAISNGEINRQNMIPEAQIALDTAKEMGQNTYSINFSLHKKKDDQTQQIQNDLFKALKKNEFTLVYQPKVNAQTNAICGLEALLRWNNPSHGSILPSRFIHLAESGGLIAEIGLWVLRNVIGQLNDWADGGLKLLPVSVNVLASEIKEAGFSNLIMHELYKSSLDVRFIELELNERNFMENKNSLISILDSISSTGMSLSVDDFGATYSSLAYFKKFSFNKIKIDQSFTDDIPKNQNAQKVLSVILKTAKELGYIIIAEGVENSAQARFFKEHNCDEMQGFYFSRPLPAAEVQKLIYR